MTQVAEYLFKEIRSDATLKNLIKVVCSEENFLDNIENVICNYSEWNILYRYALRDKEVSRIAVNRKQRRIDSNMLEIVYKQDTNADKMFKKMLTNSYVRVNDDLLNKMWLKVDMEEFAKVILIKNYSLYSIYNWSRKEEDL